MARDFGGTTDKITYTSDAVVNGLTTMSMSCWYNADNITSGGSFPRIIHKNNSASGYWQINFEGGTSILHIEFDFAGANLSKNYTNPALSTWHNLVMTHTGDPEATSAHLYVDGTEPATASTTDGTGGRSASDSANLGIGCRPSDTNRTFDGRIAEVGIWNRVLDTGEKDALAKGFSPLFFRNGLVFYVPLFGKSSTESDLVKGSGATISSTSEAVHPRIIYPSNYQIVPFSAGGAPAAGNVNWPRFMSRGFMSPGF